MRHISRRAFTLIELLIVILLIALMAAVVVPRYATSFKHMQFKSQVSEIQDLFAWAREQAISKDTTVTVSYDPQAALFSATVTAPPTTTDQPAAFASTDNPDYAQATSIPPRTVQLPARFAANLQSGGDASTSGATPGGGQGMANEFHFRSDGTVEGGQIMLADTDAGDRAMLRLWPNTGRVTREEDVKAQ